MNETTIVKRPRRLRSAAERANWVALFERSGQSAKSFCREHELTPSGLWAWRRKSRQQAAGLVQLSETIGRLAASGELIESGAAVRISFSSGVRVDVVAGTQVQWLEAVLGALTSGEL